MPQRPIPPGKLICSVRVGWPCRQSARPSSAAVRPSNRSIGCANNRSPARLTRRNRCASSKANTARLISSITVRNSAVASRAPSRCSRNVSLNAFTSNITSPNGSSRRTPRARTEKSSSRKADSRFDTVCRGRTTRSRIARAKPHQQPRIRTVSVHCVLSERPPGRSSPGAVNPPVCTPPGPLEPGTRSLRQTRSSATSTAGNPESSARSRIRRSCVSLPGTDFGHSLSQSILFKPPIKGAPAQTERFSSFHGIAVAAGQRLADQKALDLFQAHFFEARRTFSTGAQTQAARLDGVALGHEHGALDGVVQFADVARPGVFLEHLQRAWLKSGDSFAIPQCMLAQEVRRQGRNVFAPLAQRRELNFDRVQPE